MSAVELPVPASGGNILTEPSPGPAPADPEVPVAEAGTEEKIVPDLAWVEHPREIDFSRIEAFGEWSARWAKADAEERRAMEVEGLRLARERREEFKELIRQDPKQALERSVSRVIRQDLPSSIVAELETPVSTKGNLNVYGGRPADGVEIPGEQLTLRYFETSGETYRARVYGDLEAVTSRRGMPLWGVAVDGEMAVAENAVRPLEVGERIAAGTVVEETCPVSGETTEAVSAGEAVKEETPTVEIAGNLITLCNGSHVTVLEDEFRTWVQASGSGGAGYFMENFPGTSSRSIGNLRCLYIRVTYPDQMVAPNTEEDAYGDMRNVARFYLENSYGKMTTTTTVTPVVVLPQTLAWYKAKDSSNGGSIDCLGLIHNDSRAAAKKIGYDPGQYDCIIVRINKGPRLEGISWGGGSSVWITWGGMDVLNHECGHSLGRNHANYWNTTDGTAYGNGSNQEYGNSFDVMGGGGGFGAHYNMISKRALGWLNDDLIHQPVANGVYRIYAYDQPRLEEGKKYGLTVAKDSIRSYNIEYHPAAGGLLTDSALVLYSGMGSNAGHLLDTTPGSPGGKGDGGIAVGRTFSDHESDMHFTVLGKNGTTPESLDVAYYKGPFPGNQAPGVDLQASATTVTVGSAVTFTANATDANGDALAYHWEFSDGTTAANQAVVTRTFAAAAQVTAMVTVSDLKGGSTRRHVVVQVGSHGKQTITGTITAGGQPLANVRVSNGTQWAYTDANGQYALAGVNTGSQTLTATLNGYTLQPSFTNPITVVSGSNVANWTAGEGVFVSLTAGPSAVEGGANGSFTLTRTGSTTNALTVRFSPFGGTATKTTDYTFSPADAADGSYRSFTIPAGQSSLTVNVLAVNDTAQEGPETILLQLASNGNYLSRQGNALALQIQDNDTALPVVAVTSADPDGFESPADPMKFTFTRMGSTASSLNVSVSWTGTATAGADYTALPTTVTLPAGQSSVDVTVSPLNDALIEGPETVTATIQTSSAYVRHPSANTLTATIADDDTPVVQVSAPDAEASEAGPDSAVFLLTRSGSTTAPLKVYYGVHGTALHGTDYRMLSGEVTIPAGESSAPVVIEPYADDEGEVTETVTLVLTTFQHAYNVGPASQETILLKDAGDVPVVSVRTGATGAEGGASPTFIFRAVGGPAGGQVTVSYQMTGTATSGSDYTALPGTVTIPTGGSSDVTVTVPLINDTLAEPTETVGVRIVDQSTYLVLNGRGAEARILDNDSGGERVMVSTFNHSPAEPSTGGTFYFSRSGTSGNLTVNYSISGTATPGADFSGLTGSVVIPDGSSGVDVPMTVLDDALAEGTETVTVQVLSGTGYGPDTPSRATYEIADNETSAVTVGFASSILKTTELPGVNGEYRDLTVQLSAVSANPVSVEYRAAGGTANGDDVDWTFVDAAAGNAPIPSGVLTFAAGETSKPIRVRIKNDGVTEPIESALIELRAPLGASLTPGRGRQTLIIADETTDGLVIEERWSSGTVYTNQSWETTNVDVVGVLRSFTPAQGVADNYSRRLSGWITAPATGTYTFWIASDDASRLYLSSNDQPSNKVQIASVSGYTSFQAWDANSSQKSANISLVAGQSYYMEAQHQEGGGGDHVSVAWQGPGFARKVLEIAAPESTELPRARLVQSSSLRTEAEGGEPNLMVVLDRPAGVSGVTVHYSMGGTATPGEDYLGAGGSISLAAGEWVKSIPLTLLEDAVGEPAEAIVVELTSVTGAVLRQPNRHVITVVDADAPVVAQEWVTAASSQSSGTVLKTLTAQATAGRSIASWLLVSGNASGAFQLQSNGQLVLSQPSSLPSPGVVRLLVRAVDSAGASGDGIVHVVCNAPSQGVVEQRWSGNSAYQNRSWSGSPAYSGTLATFTTSQNVADNYSRRLTGFVRPAVSGDYTFWIAGDDDCRLYLSSDGDAAKAVQIAAVNGWTNYQSWDSQSSQKSAAIPLVAGRVYWMEVNHMEGGGGDHVSVAWQGPGMARQAIPSSVIFPALPGIDTWTAPMAPSVALAAPAEAEIGETVTLTATVVAGTDAVTKVEFYDGSTLLGSDTSSPYSLVWNQPALGSHTLKARAVYAGGGLDSPSRVLTVNGLDPAADADGDGYPNGLEQVVGTSPTSSASQPPAIYSQLRAWWRLNESSGTVADDSTGRVQDGTVQGAVWAAGIDQGGLEFDGTDDGVLVGPAAAITGTGSFSLSGWVKLDAGAGAATIIQQREAGSTGYQGEYMLNVNANGTVNFFVYGTSVYQFNLNTTLTVNDGQWHHIAAVREGSAGRVYIDGVEAASGSGTVQTLQARGVSLGYDLRDLNKHLDGRLDDIRIYERALSAAEIRQLREELVPNRAPVFANDPILAAGATEDEAYSGSLAAQASDPDLGDTRTFSKVSGPAWLTVAANGSLSGTPGNSDVGTSIFTVRVTDAGGLSDEAVLQIAVANVNDAPVFAQDPIFGEGATENEAYSGSLAGTASDIDAGDTLVYSKVSGPSWLSMASNGSLSGTPGSGDVGTSIFVVRATDAGGLSDEAELWIEVANVNDAPQFGSGNFQGITATEDQAYSGSIAELASDPDEDDVLSFSKISGPDWLVVAANGSLSGTPSNGDVGSNTFVVRVTDAEGAWAEAELTIVVTNVNDDPVFLLDPILAANGREAEAYTGQTLDGLATDADAGDSIHFSKVSGPEWLEVAPNGALSGTPTVGSAGLNVFVVRVTDAEGLLDEAELRILVEAAGLPSPWQAGEIGTGGLSGSESHLEGTYSLSGCGTLTSTSDRFRWIYQTLSGDGSIAVRISSMQSTGNSARVGVMIRESLASNARNVFIGLTSEGGYRWTRRTSTGGSTSTSSSSTGTVPNTWVRLVRTGNTIEAAKSADGVNWIPLGSVTVSLSTNVYMGMVVASGDANTPHTASFTQVSATP